MHTQINRRANTDAPTQKAAKRRQAMWNPKQSFICCCEKKVDVHIQDPAVISSRGRSICRAPCISLTKETHLKKVPLYQSRGCIEPSQKSDSWKYSTFLTFGLYSYVYQDSQNAQQHSGCKRGGCLWSIEDITTQLWRLSVTQCRFSENSSGVCGLFFGNISLCTRLIGVLFLFCAVREQHVVWLYTERTVQYTDLTSGLI